MTIADPALPQTKTVRFSDMERFPEIAFVLVVAADVERKWMLSRMKPLKDQTEILKVTTAVGTDYVGQCGLYPCVLVNCEAGSGGRSGSTLAISDAIDQWRPYAVLLLGIAFGGDEEKQVFGDVLASTQVIPYELERLSDKRNEPRSPRPEANITLLNRLRHLGWSWTPEGADKPREVDRVPILSGEKLFDNKDERDAIFDEYPTAKGGEMEGAGLYAAAERRGRPWIIIKAICDWGYGKDKTHQPLAARNATEVVEKLLFEPTLEARDLGVHASPAETRAERAMREQTRSLRLQELRLVIGEAYRSMEAKLKEMGDFAIANKKPGEPESPALDAKVAKLYAERNVAVERMLNAYNAAASAVLSGEIDRKQFANELGTEMREFCEEQDNVEIRARMQPRATSSYPAIWAAYDELRASGS